MHGAYTGPSRQHADELRLYSYYRSYKLRNIPAQLFTRAYTCTYGHSFTLLCVDHSFHEEESVKLKYLVEGSGSGRKQNRKKMEKGKREITPL